MAEIKVIRFCPRTREPATLMALGLGSCVAVCLFDSVARIAGMAHVVLPQRLSGGDEPPGKYADTAIPALIAEMTKAGAYRGRLVAAIAGGAQIFATESQPARQGIGARNSVAVEEALDRSGARLLASDVGGSAGRTLRLQAHDGCVTVKTIGQGERMLVTLASTATATTGAAA